MNSEYHIPVLLQPCVEGLIKDASGVYCDLTFGGGGHSSEIVKHLSESGKLFGFDQDKDAAKNALDHPIFQFVPQNFRYLKKSLRLYQVREVDGILADLGVSSFQFNEAERGFSIRFDGPLDMRMNRQQELTAKVLIDTYEEEALASVLYNYGELGQSRKIASKIKGQSESIHTTMDLIKLLQGMVPGQKENQFLARVFQALRIEINNEMDALQEMLEQSLEILKPGGRLVIMSYHSLEDRLVKNFMRSGNLKGEIVKDFYGKPETPFKLITRKPIVPSAEEMKQNPRSRSAKLRIAEKL